MSVYPGIITIVVSLSQSSADITYDPTLTSPQQIIDKINDMGFIASSLGDRKSSPESVSVNHPSTDEGSRKVPAEAGTPLAGGSKGARNRETEGVISVGGMHCNSCTRTIEGTLGGMAGVSYVKVSLLNELATVKYDASVVTLEELRKAIEAAGDFVATLDTDGCIPIMFQYCLIEIIAIE